MPKTSPLYCSDDLIHSLIEASHCSFVLLAMRREDKPIDVLDVANLLDLEIIPADNLLNTLLHFGFILPVEDGDRYVITPSGIDMLSPAPANSPFHYDPELPIDGDRLPSYVAFDLLPLRIYAYRSKFNSDEHKN